MVVTGEGRLDGQTVMGKAPIGVAKIAKEYGKPVIAFSGCVTKDAIACNEPVSYTHLDVYKRQPEHHVHRWKMPADHAVHVLPKLLPNKQHPDALFH